MSMECSICKRNYMPGNTRSHSNIASKKRRKVNLQSALYNGKRVKACTRCIKTLSKVKKTK